jgi:hypothetical protein
MKRSVIGVSLWLAFFCLPALATGPEIPTKSSFSTDESDLWWNPNENGWGMQIVQSAEILFVTLFVYDQNAQPTFFVATLNPTGTYVWSGDLYKTNGTFYGGAYNAQQFAGRKVGSLTFSAPDSISAGTVTYGVDGVGVTKAVQRQPLKYDNYNGTFVTAVNLVSTGCFNPAENGSVSSAFTIAINQAGTVMSMGWTFPSGGFCTYGGTYSQAGRMGLFNGTYSCTSGERGLMEFIEMTVRIGMISGRILGHSTNVGCSYTGRFTGLIPL